MWAFRGHTPVRLPGTPGEVDDFDRALSGLTNSTLPSNAFSLLDGHQRLTASNRQQRPPLSWSTSETGSTLAAVNNDPKPVDVEREATVVAPPPPSSPVAFWSPALAPARRYVCVKYSWTLFVLCLFVLGVLSIYWGALFRIKENLHHATIAVVDFDGQIPPYDSGETFVGSFVVDAVRVAAAQQYTLGYTFHDPADYDFDPLRVRRAVHHEDVWGAIIINANASSLIRQAVETGNTSYDPAGACQIVYNQARDVEAYNQYVIPTLQDLATEIVHNFGSVWTRAVLTNTSLLPTVYAQAPQALSPGIAFTVYNLRPFDPPVAIPAVSIGLIYLIIIAFFSFSFFMPIHALFVTPTTTIEPHPPLRFLHLILFRYVATMTAYFFLSLSYSLVSLVFQLPFSNKPPVPTTKYPTDNVAFNANLLGPATFPVYWALNFAGMSALGLPLEIAAMLLSPSTQPWTSLFLIFWVITNVSTGFYALELAPPFYRWGHVWPLRQIVYGSRALLFGTRNQLGLNFGLLVAWIVVASFVWVPSCFVLRGRMTKRVKETASAAAATGGGSGGSGSNGGGDGGSISKT